MNKLFTGAIVVALIVGIYAYINRDSKIRKECQNEAEIKSVKSAWTDGNYIDDADKREVFELEMKDKYYNECVRNRGLSQ